MTPMMIEMVKDLVAADGPILSRFTESVEILMKGHAAQYLNLQPKLMLCDVHNRSALGLNPYEVHRVGCKIAQVGFNYDELLGAVCIDMQPGPEARKAHIDFNIELANS